MHCFTVLLRNTTLLCETNTFRLSFFLSHISVVSQLQIRTTGQKSSPIPMLTLVNSNQVSKSSSIPISKPDPYVKHDFKIWINLSLFFFLNTAGLNVSKQRLLSAHLPFLPASISEREKTSYLSSCISFDSHLMVSQLSTYHPTHQFILVQEVNMNCQSFCCAYLCVWVCVNVHACMCVDHWVAEGTWSSVKMSGQEESGSWAGRQQCSNSYPAVPHLHAVRYALIQLHLHTCKQPLLLAHIYPSNNLRGDFVLVYIQLLLSHKGIEKTKATSCRYFHEWKALLFSNVHCFFLIQKRNYLHWSRHIQVRMYSHHSYNINYLFEKVHLKQLDYYL